MDSAKCDIAARDQQIEALTAERDRMRAALEWIDSNTTFYNVDRTRAIDGANIPVLAQVSERIWYHATDDIGSYPFSAVVSRALESAANPLPVEEVK